MVAPARNRVAAAAAIAAPDLEVTFMSVSPKGVLPRMHRLPAKLNSNLQTCTQRSYVSDLLWLRGKPKYFAKVALCMVRAFGYI
jgi:hypothetical protein